MTDAERDRRIALHVWNYLGLSDPDEVAAWIRDAIAELKESRRKLAIQRPSVEDGK